MFNWDGDPLRTERGIQMLLRKKYPGLRSFDGAGGDGGRDAQVFITSDDRTVFEIKSFGRLTSSRRRQVERSLGHAVESVPDMKRWILVVPMNMTPRRPGARSSEEAWFDGTLPAIAPGVELAWWGRDWLDLQLAEDMAVQRYIEGADAQVLQRAAEFGMEQDVLTGGASDLASRLDGLRRRVDEVSPYWTLDFAVRDGIRYSTLRGKVPDADVLDPITLTPTFTFRAGDPVHDELRERFEQTLAFGGTVDIPAGHVTAMEIDASAEARLLLGERDPATTEFTFVSRREQLDRSIRCAYQVLDGRDAVVSEFAVFLRERTAGMRGVTLFGGDAADVVALEVSLPWPGEVPGPGEVFRSEDTRLNLTLPESAVGYDVDSLRPVLRTLVAATPGTSFRMVLPGLGTIASGPLSKQLFEDLEATAQVVEDLDRLQQATGSALRYPSGLTVGQVRELRGVARQLADEYVEHDGGMALTLKPEAIGSFLDKIDRTPGDEVLGGLWFANDNYGVELGDVVLPYGPAAFWAPHARLANRPELEAFAASTPPTDGPIQAQFEPTDVAFRWVPRSLAVAHFETGARPTESDL